MDECNGSDMEREEVDDDDGGGDEGIKARIRDWMSKARDRTPTPSTQDVEKRREGSGTRQFS